VEEVHARKWKLDAPTQDTAYFWRRRGDLCTEIHKRQLSEALTRLTRSIPGQVVDNMRSLKFAPVALGRCWERTFEIGHSPFFVHSCPVISFSDVRHYTSLLNNHEYELIILRL
jgi:hypothetical protein